jgi:hypothetical protein
MLHRAACGGQKDLKSFTRYQPGVIGLTIAGIASHLLTQQKRLARDEPEWRK